MRAPAQPKWMTITGWVLTILVVAMMLMTGSMAFTDKPEVKEGMEKLGLTQETGRKIGAVEMACAVVYAIPQTSVLGAILLTGYLGGATFVHVHQGDSIGTLLTPIIVGVVVWLGVFLREPRLRAIVPWRTAAKTAMDT
jgi:hypothetical protein